MNTVHNLQQIRFGSNVQCTNQLDCQPRAKTRESRRAGIWLMLLGLQLHILLSFHQRLNTCSLETQQVQGWSSICSHIQCKRFADWGAITNLGACFSGSSFTFVLTHRATPGRNGRLPVSIIFMNRSVLSKCSSLTNSCCCASVCILDTLSEWCAEYTNAELVSLVLQFAELESLCIWPTQLGHENKHSIRILGFIHSTKVTKYTWRESPWVKPKAADWANLRSTCRRVDKKQHNVLGKHWQKAQVWNHCESDSQLVGTYSLLRHTTISWKQDDQ